MDAASQLFAALPTIGGKVGAVNFWRKSLDETLAFGWEAFLSLRTTFPTEGTPSTVFLLADLLRSNSSAEKYQASLSWQRASNCYTTQSGQIAMQRPCSL